MAETDNIDALSQSLGKLKDAFVPALKDALGITTKDINDASSSIDKMANNAALSSLKLEELSKNTKNLGEVGSRNVGILNTALLGTRQLADDLNKRNFSGFANAFDDVKKSVIGSGGALSDVGSILDKTFGSSGKKIMDFVHNIGASADNAIAMQNAVLNLAASTGTLDNVFKAAGSDLQKLSGLILEQESLILGTAKATALLPMQVEKYYSSLAQVPKALSSTVDMLNKQGSSSDVASKGMSMFAATILTAVGSGRDFNEIQKDLIDGFDKFGLSGKEALKFTSNMGAVSNNTGVQLHYVRQALLQEAEAFGRFSDAGEKASKMSDGLANIMSNYVQRLKDVGMTGPSAINAVKEMTGQIGNMGIAQKAFLSGQTGGPGGLMGAFQIDKLLKDGKIEEVFNKVRQQMKSQLGSIVTLEEGTQSQAAAAQLTRQMQILKQGPLGGMVKNDQDAFRLLEAFKGQEMGKKIDIKEFMPEKALEQTMGRGQALQQMQRTPFNEIAEKIYQGKIASEFSNVNTFRDLFAAKGSGSQLDTGKSREMFESKQNQRDRMLGGMMESADISKNIGSALGENKGNFKVNANRMMQDYLNSVMSLVDVGGAYESMKKMFSKTKSEQVALEKDLAAAKTEAEKSAIQESLKDVKKRISEQETNIKEYDASVNSKIKESITKGQKVSESGKMAESAGEKVGASVPRTKGPAIAAEGTTKEEKDISGDVHVHITGYCINCKSQIEGGSQMAAISPAAKRTTP